MPKCTQCGQDVLERAAFCHWCGNQLMTSPADVQDAQIREIQLRVDDVATLVNQHVDFLERFEADVTYLRDLTASSRVYTKRFWIRSLAIWGHVLVPTVAMIIIAITVIYVLRMVSII